MDIPVYHYTPCTQSGHFLKRWEYAGSRDRPAVAIFMTSGRRCQITCLPETMGSDVGTWRRLRNAMGAIEFRVNFEHRSNVASSFRMFDLVDMIKDLDVRGRKLR
ncbi:hypothetical protein JTE90_022383 [Oedothorax gibbosus]|uniref:Uncharacterized protein n=1 Tax=Oedothorax gibbosus TaxID=931172 RepID=A0AAV6UM10_9ARAC|nr:hypothetical protein JTE90_022383 [Oedothorax gibbosus]